MEIFPKVSRFWAVGILIMSLILPVLACFVGISAFVVTIAALRSPLGYEDENGFHLGPAPEDTENRVIHAEEFSHREAA